MAPPSSTPPRFLIGSGERLTEPTKYVTGPKPAKSPAYSPEDAARRLMPRVNQTVRSINALPEAARPSGEAIALVTMHPEFLAKTFLPFHRVEFTLTALAGGIGIFRTDYLSVQSRKLCVLRMNDRRFCSLLAVEAIFRLKLVIDVSPHFGRSRITYLPADLFEIGGSYFPCLSKDAADKIGLSKN